MGMLLYKKLVSPFFVKYVSMALQKVLGILGRIGRFLLRPFLAAGRTATVTVCTAGTRMRSRMGHVRRFLKKKLTFFIKVLKMNL